MPTPMKRIAINCGGNYVPGLNAVITGTVLAALELGWEVVGLILGLTLFLALVGMTSGPKFLETVQQTGLPFLLLGLPPATQLAQGDCRKHLLILTVACSASNAISMAPMTSPGQNFRQCKTSECTRLHSIPKLEE